MRRRGIIDLALLLALVALFAIPLGLRLGVEAGTEGYAGSDAGAADAVQSVDPAYRPWITPWFEPSSGEIESGLFALQAALGAGALGFSLGRLSGRRGSASVPSA